MRPFVFTSFVFTCLFLLAQASIPSRGGLRFKEVDADELGPNSVSATEVQGFAVAMDHIQNRVVSQAKMAPLSVNAAQIAPGAVTASGASLDMVKLVIKNDATIPARSQNPTVTIPSNAQSVQPWEAIDDPTVVVVDNPNSDTAYRVEGKARGPGVILGWFPSENGHLLRYQASRALRGIVCAAIDVGDIPRNSACACTIGSFNADGTTVTPSCTCDIDIAFQNVNWRSDIVTCGGCTVLDCSVPAALPDPNCDPTSTDSRHNPFDVEGDFRPDRCNPFTSVEDVQNPQEGVPVYSPSVERITIDDTGRVEMWFFGRGNVEGAHEEITVTVVVLLDDQYGA